MLAVMTAATSAVEQYNTHQDRIDRQEKCSHVGPGRSPRLLGPIRNVNLMPSDLSLHCIVVQLH